MIKIKRIYDEPEKNDGFRILVDRLWPRGLSKEKAKIDKWVRDIAPSDNLRKWFAHREGRWHGFKGRYLRELENKKELVKPLKEMAKKHTVTLLYAAKDKERNNAKALLEVLKQP